MSRPLASMSRWHSLVTMSRLSGLMSVNATWIERNSGTDSRSRKSLRVNSMLPAPMNATLKDTTQYTVLLPVDPAARPIRSHRPGEPLTPRNTAFTRRDPGRGSDSFSGGILECPVPETAFPLEVLHLPGPRFISPDGRGL